MRVLFIAILFLLLGGMIVVDNTHNPNLQEDQIHVFDDPIPPEDDPPIIGILRLNEYNETSAININGDADIPQYSSTGDGSAGDPYILENYNITSTSVPIQIRDTRSHIIIRDSIFSNYDNSKSLGSVYLLNTSNIVFENNTILKGQNGIYMNAVDGVIVKNNYVLDVRTPGSLDGSVYLTGANDVLIENNTIINGPIGMGVFSSDYITIKNNTISDIDDRAIYASSSTYIDMQDNVINNSPSGVYIYSSDYVAIATNTISKIAGYAIYASLSTFITTQSNTIYDIPNSISESVIHFVRTEDSVISGENITEFGDKGIILYATNNVTVENSHISDADPGIEVFYSTSYTTYGYYNRIINNTIVGNEGSAIFERARNTVIANNTIDMEEKYRTAIENNGNFKPLIENNTIYRAQTAIELLAITSSARIEQPTLRFNTIIDSNTGIRGSYVADAIVHNNTISNSGNRAIHWEDFNTGYYSHNNSFMYNVFSGNYYAFQIGSNNGMNITLNYIANSGYAGISISYSPNNVWINNNTVINSSSYGLSISGTAGSGSNITFNDFINNGGSGSQVADYSGYTIEKNYYNDHTNIDAGGDGYADFAYDFDGSANNDDPTPLATFTVPYTPFDNQAPSFTKSPSSTEIIEFGSTGNFLNWTAIDENPNKYTITKDGSPLSGHNQQTWDSPQNISISIDGLDIGTYEYIITISDTWDNEFSQTVTLIVQDSTAPKITEGISTGSIEYGSIDELTWTATDIDPKNYSVIIDGKVKIDGASWVSGVQNSIDISPSGFHLGLGAHTIILKIYDQSENAVFHSYPLTLIDSTTPKIQEKPADDIAFLESTLSYIVTYNATDSANSSYYQIWVNQAQQGVDINWINATDIDIDLVDYLDTKGIYNFTIIFYDTEGNYDRHQISITYGDLIDPVPDTPLPPSNIDAELGVSGPDVSLTVTDSNPTRFLVYLDGKLVKNETWISGQPKTYTIPDNISIGVHDLTFHFLDVSNNSYIFEMTITVSDTLSPILQEKPVGDIAFLESTLSYIVTYNATDSANSSYYQIWVNQAQQGVDIDWVNATDIDIDLVDYLDTKGVYNFTIIFYDTGGNYDRHSISITYGDLIDPVPDTPLPPSNIDAELGVSGPDVSLTVSDSNPTRFLVYLDGKLVKNETWISGQPKTYTIPDNISIGVHDLTFHFLDISNNSYILEMTITVSDTLPPALAAEPADISYITGELVGDITWDFSDAAPGTYRIELDKEEVVPATLWDGGPITHNVDGLPLGEHNVTIIVTDLGGRQKVDIVLVTVTDPNPPVFISKSAPLDNSILEGDNTKMISWTFADSNPDTYVIAFENGTVVDTGNWTSNDPIEYGLSGLPYGIYNFTITVYDKSGHPMFDSIEIEVLDNMKPVITSPGDATLELGTGIYQFNWSATDLHPDYYIIYVNNQPLPSNDWISGDAIFIDFDPSALGVYNYTIVFVDLAGNKRVDVIEIAVLDTIKPDLSDSTDIVASIGEVVNINWTVTDASTGSYTILLNETSVVSGSWLSGDLIAYEFTPNAAGLYNITVLVVDASGNIGYDSITVIVEEEIVPSDPTTSEETSPTDTSISETSTTSSSSTSSSTTEDSPLLGWMLAMSMLGLSVSIVRRKYRAT